METHIWSDLVKTCLICVLVCGTAAGQADSTSQTAPSPPALKEERGRILGEKPLEVRATREGWTEPRAVYKI